MRRGTAGIVLALQLYSIQGLPRIFRHRSELRAAVLQWESPEGREQLLADAGHISTWEVSAVTNMSGLFQELVRFNEDLSAWNTSSVVDLSMAFARASSFNSSIAGWDTSKVVDMSWMFAGASAFNQPIGDWNTSRVQSMQGMFYGAWAFNQSLSSWNTSRVADLSYMFAGAVSFDAAVGRWNTSAVTDMSFLFSSAQAFNQQIGAWNTSSVTNMAGMFLDAKLFSQRVGLWNTSKVLNMSMMFKYAYTFNQPIGGWNTSHVIDMRAMFSYAPNFNRPIGSWDTSRVLSMREMFREADAFSQPLGKWNTTGVIDMSRMFQSANNFNQPLAGWDTSSVANMALMFTDAESFDQPIGGWNTSLVTDMRYMFAGARLFNQPIGEWDTSKVEDMRFMFAGTYTFNQPLHWNTSKARKMFSMFTFTRSFNQPLGHWDTSSVRRIENIFAFAKRFSQPVGSWDMSHVHNPASVFWNANMSDCVKSATRSAWGLEARGNQSGARKRWHARCPACGNSSCGRSDLACVDGFCAPLSAGYVHLGPASWTIEEGLEVGGRGLGACQEACDEQQECLGFLLGRGRCVLHLGQGDPLPLRSHISAWRAFLKATCGSFSCPSNSALKATPSFPQLVTEASCCSCPDPGTVQDLESDKLHLKCSACATGSIPDPAQQNCVSCPPGSVARAGMAHCQVCGLSSKPSDSRGDCIPCGHGQYRLELADECLDCKLPKLLWAEKCVWWHLPLIPIGAIALLLSLCLILSHVKKRHQKEQARVCADQTAVMESLERELWDEEPGTADTLTKYTTALKAFGMKEDEVVAQLEQSRKEQSLRAGVSMRYLLSPDFVYLATSRTNHTDPTFNEMKSFFWQCEDPPPLGLCLRCPRDGRRGCALVDWLPRPERREQTHFLSWAWAYRLSEVRSALHMYQVSTHPPVRTEKVFFFMCFFVNNQFRIIVERSMAGSNVLGEVFKSNLTRLNRVVAILDTWRDPIYLSRVWTIYEQFLASKEQVPVTFTMPFSANESLQQQISRGEVGIWEITQSVSCIDAQNAIAYDPKDEEEVKRAIQETSTFEQVNKHVTDVMARWIGEVASLQFQQLISVARESRAEGAVVVPSRLEGAASCESLPLSSGSEGICV